MLARFSSDFKALGNIDAKENWGPGPKRTGLPTGGVEFTILLSIKIGYILKSPASFYELAY